MLDIIQLESNAEMCDIQHHAAHAGVASAMTFADTG
jgi:hypothetical protein